MKKKILWGLLIVLVIIQFIRPEKNKSATISANDLSTQFDMPANVQGILKKACNDCHSNNTVYPWYSNIQPVGWWLQKHVNDGKKELNFSEFGNYTAKRQRKKWEEIAEEVREKEMPLKSYTYTHSGARLSAGDREMLVSWAESHIAQP